MMRMDSKDLEKVLAGNPVLSEEERIALRYLNMMHDMLQDQNSLFARIEGASVEGYRKRYQKAVEHGIMVEDYAVELKLVEDAGFRKRIFGLYKTQCQRP